MGGIGSGRWGFGFKKDVVEDFVVADVNKIHRKEKLCPGMKIRLIPGGEWIELEWTSCNFGGKRPWFVCPGIYCMRRASKLYYYNGYFRCKHCLNLANRSQQQDKLTRLICKAHKIKEKLGVDSPGNITSIPPRPKRMKRKTYRKLAEELIQTTDRVTGMIGMRF